MTIQEMIEELQSMIDSGTDENTEVRLAMQPTYPFEYTIGRVEVVHELGENDESFVYIGEGNQEGYLPAIVSEQFGWR